MLIFLSGRSFSSFIQTFVSLAACWFILLLIIILHIYCEFLISLTFNAEIKNLKSQNEELKIKEKNLNEKCQIFEKTQNELNVSRAQWSVDAYCPKLKNVRKCESCQDAWLVQQSSCYEYNDAPPSEQRTWAGAREDCRGKSSDLAVAADEQERNYIVDRLSPVTKGINGYWIGVRARNRTWKWINGTDLFDHYNLSCVTSLSNRGWRSASCNDKNGWICEKKALLV
uniref:C-type lectin domain-containing protein n=1 Tax=Nothobranchius furzeri TaxID=105023 RepID=A0A8C6LPB0_NOTFU